MEGVRLGGLGYVPRTNPNGPDYYGGDRRTPVPLMEVPPGIVIEQLPAGPEPTRQEIHTAWLLAATGKSRAGSGGEDA